MRVLYGAVYPDSPVNGLVTCNERFIAALRGRVDLHLLTGAWATRGSASRNGVGFGTEKELPAIVVERDARTIDRCTVSGPQFDRFVEDLAAALLRSRIELVHMAEWEPLTGLAIFAAADRARIPWIVMPVDYRLACAQVWLQEQRVRDCAGPLPTFDNCAHCMAAPDLFWGSGGRKPWLAAAETLYRTGLRRALPPLVRLPLPAGVARHRRVAQDLLFTRGQWRGRFQAVRDQLRSCRAIVTFSDFHAAVLRKILDLPESLFRVVHFPSPAPAAFVPDPDRFRAPIRFVWVNRLGREWGPELLLDAWRRAALPPDVAQLWMYATSGARRWAHRRGDGDLIASGSLVLSEERVQGREPEVYRHAAAYLATPVWKVNGYNYDVFAYRLPMVFPRGTVFEEIHKDGVDSFAYALGDATSLAGLIRMLAHDPARLQAASAKAVFRPEYAIPACGESLLRLYRDIVPAARDAVVEGSGH